MFSKWFKKDIEKEMKENYERRYRIRPLSERLYIVEIQYSWSSTWFNLTYNYQGSYFSSEQEALDAIEENKKLTNRIIKSAIKDEEFRRKNPPRIIE